MARAYLYGRHSSRKQDITEDVQKARCMDYYERVLKPEGVEWAGWFYDAAKSASIPFSERDQGRAITALLQPGDYLVFVKLDRAFRSLVDGCKVIQQLSQRNVEVVSLDVMVDTSKAIGRFFRQIMLAVGELEREMTRERTLEVIAYRKAQGLPHSHSCPIGWKIVGQAPRREYRADPHERDLCDRLAAMQAAGMSQDTIALWCISQKEMPNKRRFTDRTSVRWALQARLLHYPKMTSYKALRKAVRSGQL